MRRQTAVNTLRLGEVSALVSANPMSKQYGAAAEEMEGFDVVEGGVKPMLVPILDREVPLRYRAQHYRGAYYLRNSTVSIEDQVTLPTETIVNAVSLWGKVQDMLNAGQVRSGITDTTSSEYIEYRDSGRYTIDRGVTVGKLVDGTAAAGDRVLIITKPTKIYRAFFPCVTMGENAAQLDGWGVHGSITRTWKEKTYLLGNTTHNSSDKQTVFGAARGAGTKSDTDTEFFPLGTGYERSEVSVSIAIFSETLPAGTYRINTDLFLVGTAKMFKAAPQSRSYKFSHTHESAKASVSVVEDRAWTSESDSLVLAWGANSDAASAWAMFSYDRLEDTSNNDFYFLSRSLISGVRRFGPAVFRADPTMFGATASYLMGGSSDQGRAIPAADPTGASAYVVKLDGGVVWFEPVRQGILIGTKTSEYLLSGEQVSAAVSGGAGLQRLSAVGSPGKIDDLLSQSANLAGNVYYISSYGITTLAFSTEAQSYLPRTIEFQGRRIAGTSCTSIAPNIKEECLYLTFSDGTVWKAWPKYGAMAKVPLDIPDSYKLHGVIDRDGECWLVIIKPNGTRYISDVTNARAQAPYLRTTAFGRGPFTRTQIKKVVITGSALKIGEVRIGQSGAWTAIPLTAEEKVSGLTGVKEFRVPDRPGRLAEGKTVEFRMLDPDGEVEDPGALVSIAVEMEV